MGRDEGEITQVLEAAVRGDAGAVEDLLPLVYEELKGIAHGRVVRAPRQTLQTTDLVHECWLRLEGSGASWESRRHFFGAAVRAMRNILIEQARRRSALKRDNSRKVELVAVESEIVTDPSLDDVLTFNDVLEKLEGEHERAAQVVALRFFGGLSMPEVAEVTGSSLATVERDWRFARAWLQTELEETFP